VGRPLDDDAVRRLDREHVWQPFTAIGPARFDNTWPVIREASGVWLTCTDGTRLLDACGSWWVSALGHGHPRVTAALHHQLDTLPHVILAQTLHEPAALLAARLAKVTPDGLERTFFTDNGSTAVEVALRASLQWHDQNGQPERTTFLHLKHAYHGDTLGAVSTGGIDLFHGRLGRWGFRTVELPSPATDEATALQALEDCLTRDGSTVAALILEPLIQAAAGMRMYSTDYLRQARQLTDRAGVHLIVDEVFTGFGRTLELFACGLAGISPDFLCLSKGLTGGVLPFGAMVTTDRIHSGFAGGTDRALLYGHSFAGNPMGCAAALAVLDAFEHDGVLEHARSLQPELDAAVTDLSSIAGVHDVQRTGFVVRLQLGEHGSYGAKIGERVRERALAHGLLLRPLGNVVYFVPALTIRRTDLTWMFDRAKTVIRECLDTP
jgi:adenosylmethionine-8-amino-7-oxononanoate aminotransferase